MTSELRKEHAETQATGKTLATERRARFLTSLIKEGILNVLVEQQPQPAPPPMPTEPPAPVSDLAPEAPPEQVAPQFTVDDMIERLNVIRGGRSFTDPEVYGQLVSYFKQLDEEKKTNLQNFLVELGKIVINVNQQDQPKDSSDALPPPASPPVSAPAAPPAPAAAPAGAPPAI